MGSQPQVRGTVICHPCLGPRVNPTPQICGRGPFISCQRPSVLLVRCPSFRPLLGWSVRLYLQDTVRLSGPTGSHGKSRNITSWNG